MPEIAGYLGVAALERAAHDGESGRRRGPERNDEERNP
jgi:hypothetical protein